MNFIILLLILVLTIQHSSAFSVSRRGFLKSAIASSSAVVLDVAADEIEEEAIEDTLGLFLSDSIGEPSSSDTTRLPDGSNGQELADIPVDIIQLFVARKRVHR